MEEENMELKTLTYNLTLQFTQTAALYPDLAESWLQILEKSLFQQRNPKENPIYVQLIFFYRPSSDQTFGYKVIKLQRMIIMFGKLSQKLPFFDRIEEVMIIQDQDRKSKKGASKSLESDDKQQVMSFYMEKTETILQKMVKKYNNALTLLKIKLQNKVRFTLEQFVKRTSLSISNKIQQRALAQKENELKCFKTELIQLVNCIREKVCCQLREILVGLVKEGAKDEMTGNFLSGRHNFLRIETFDYNKNYQNQRNGKFWMAI